MEIFKVCATHLVQVRSVLCAALNLRQQAGICCAGAAHAFVTIDDADSTRACVPVCNHITSYARACECEPISSFDRKISPSNARRSRNICQAICDTFMINIRFEFAYLDRTICSCTVQICHRKKLSFYSIYCLTTFLLYFICRQSYNTMSACDASIATDVISYHNRMT